MPKNMKTPLWDLFCEIRDEAASGYPNCRVCAQRDGQWKAKLSAFRYDFMPLLATPGLSAESDAFWHEVGECVPWIYRALERPRKRLPKSYEPELHSLQKTLIWLGCGPDAAIDISTQYRAGPVPASASFPHSPIS